MAKEWGVTTEGLRSKTRTKTLTVPRQVAMYLMRELLGMQLVEIGAAFGGRDHSTVIHSLERVGAMMNGGSVVRAARRKDPGRVGKSAELNMERAPLFPQVSRESSGHRTRDHLDNRALPT